MEGKSSRAEVVAAVVSVLVFLGGVMVVYGGLSRELSAHEVRLTHTEEDSRTTAEILEDLVPAVAALEERTKGM